MVGKTITSPHPPSHMYISASPSFFRQNRLVCDKEPKNCKFVQEVYNGQIPHNKMFKQCRMKCWEYVSPTKLTITWSTKADEMKKDQLYLNGQLLFSDGLRTSATYRLYPRTYTNVQKQYFK